MGRAKGTLACIVVLAAVVLVAKTAAYDEDRPRAYRNAEPGNIAYYVLVLDWSPTYCLHEGRDRGDKHCNSDRSDEFVMHGLWPQYANGWPEDCYKGERPWIPSDVIDEMLDIMPSKYLIIHEYKTHGTCTGLAPARYFDAARKAYEQVNVPAAFIDPTTQRFASPEKIESAFTAANDWLEADMIAVTCRRGNLFDVRICFSDDLRPQACGANINQKQLCPLERITVTVP
jgi:ribonuclease T2